MTESTAKTIISRRELVASWIGTLGLALTTLGFGLSTSAISSGTILLLLGGLMVVDKIVKTIQLQDRLFVGALNAYLVVALGWTLAALQIEHELATDNFRELLKIAGIPALAAGWWMVHGHLKFRYLLLFFIASALIGTLTSINVAELQVISATNRPHLTTLNPNELGFLAGALLLASTTLLLSHLGERRQSAESSWAYTLLLGTISILAIGLVLISQSRAVMLALAVALTFALGLRGARALARTRYPTRNAALVALMLVGLGMAAALSPLGKALGARFDSLENTLYLFQNIDTREALPADFQDQMRLWLWRDGLEQVKKAPLLGRGLGSPRKLIAASEIQQITHYNHYHSFWLNTLVNIGALGALGFLLLFLRFTYVGLKAALNEDQLVSWLTLALWIYFLVISLVQLRINHPSGQAFLILCSGMSLYSLFGRKRSEPTR